MGDRKDIRPEETLNSLKKMEKNMEAIRGAANKMRRAAAEADSEIGDDIGKKQLDCIISVAEAIENAVTDGEERIRELERKVERDRDESDRLSGER